VFKWIRKHKIWTIFLSISIIWIIHVGYTNLWQPKLMIEDAHDLSLNATKTLLASDTIDQLTELIKAMTPLLLPLITWKLRGRMDGSVSRATTKVVREKLKIGNRRKVYTETATSKRAADKKLDGAIKKSKTKKKLDKPK